MGQKEVIVGSIILSAVLFSLLVAVSAQPNGASFSVVRNERAPTNSTSGSHGAYAGNVTELNIGGGSVTQAWQGYFGNVSGTLQLADANNNVLYNWSLASPSGEVYASTNQTITWTNIQCFNFTANGQGGDESGNGGTTNLNGTNLTTLETLFNIDAGDIDGVDETFSLVGSVHDAFFTASQSFSAGECPSTALFDSTGEGVDGNFEEALLYEPASGSVVFASIIESGSVNGYDGSDYDFEMLVLEDGHGVDVTATTYYFFVEIE